MVQMNLFAKQKWRHEHREQIYGYQEAGGWGKDEQGDCDSRIYTIDAMCKIDN